MSTRPLTRADCAGIPRPCPFVSCCHHLLLEVRGATVWLNHPRRMRAPEDFDPTETLERMPHTCSLDVTEVYPDGCDLDTIGQLSGVTRQAIDLSEGVAIKKVRLAMAGKEWEYE